MLLLPEYTYFTKRNTVNNVFMNSFVNVIQLGAFMGTTPRGSFPPRVLVRV